MLRHLSAECVLFVRQSLKKKGWTNRVGGGLQCFSQKLVVVEYGGRVDPIEAHDQAVFFDEIEELRELGEL